MLTQVTSPADYDSTILPYGEQLSGGSGTTHKFTGKERDPESGLDNFGARYDSSSLGRFMSPDSAPPILDNPQSWNRYAFALNNPLRFVDPDGDYSVEFVTVEFDVTFESVDQKTGKKVTSSVHVTVNATFVYNDDGSLASASFRGRASNKSSKFTTDQLRVIGLTAERLFRQSFGKDFGSTNKTRGELATAVSAQESTVGVKAPNNPLQLAASSGTKPKADDAEYNIDKALDELAWRVKKYDLFKALARYNGADDPEGYAEKVTKFYNGILSTETKFEFRPQSPVVQAPRIN